tara:strand:- start:1491 stop:1949 length:459 start_codon:yes stop_codon:yes gene_type:complete
MAFVLDSLSWPELGLRLGGAVLIGLCLGYDRLSNNKPIGYQSYVIITVITALLAMLAIELNAQFNTGDDFIRLDLGKIISGVLTGIGFLGAGAITKRDEDTVIGTATGASIWAAGGLGLIIGFGHYVLALVGFVVIWAVLAVIPYYLNTRKD